MQDRYGRKIDYMRISVTDRCNLRCRYCMPSQGVQTVGRDEILRFDEILKIVSACSRQGIKNVRITGGEPLVRREISRLVGDIKNLTGIENVTLTTNGVLLSEQIDGLVRAGVDGVNISLDTLRPERYEAMTGFDRLPAVLDAISECEKYPGLTVKVNSVLIDGFNDDEAPALAALARERDISVRFIELMPIGLGKSFGGCSQDAVMERLVERFGQAVKIEDGKQGCGMGAGPAVYYQFPGFKGKIGFISALSHSFCEACNRVRLTSEGLLKPCLQYAGGEDLKAAVRGGASDDELAELVREAIFEKPQGHCFSSEQVAGGEDKLMSRIGG